MSKTVSFVLPIYKNEASLGELYAQITSVMKQVKDVGYTMVFVVDGSPDNSLEVLKQLAKKDPAHVHIVNFSRNFGHQAAIQAGLNYATGDAVIVMDADLQDPPHVCRDLIAKWQEGYDVVYAQRRPRTDYSWFRRTVSEAYYRMLGSMSSVAIPRNVGEFRLLDRRVVDAVRGMKEYHRFLRGLVAYVGFKQVGVEFDRDPRFDEGKTSYSFKKLIQLAKDGIFGFSDVPLQFVTRLGFAVSALSVVGILYAVALRLFFPQIAIPGWTMIVVAIFFMGGVQLVMLGVIGEYIGRIYNEVRNRPNYIVAEEIKTDGKKT